MRDPLRMFGRPNVVLLTLLPQLVLLVHGSSCSSTARPARPTRPTRPARPQLVLLVHGSSSSSNSSNSSSSSTARPARPRLVQLVQLVQLVHGSSTARPARPRLVQLVHGSSSSSTARPARPRLVQLVHGSSSSSTARPRLVQLVHGSSNLVGRKMDEKIPCPYCGSLIRKDGMSKHCGSTQNQPRCLGLKAYWKKNTGGCPMCQQERPSRNHYRYENPECFMLQKLKIGFLNHLTKPLDIPDCSLPEKDCVFSRNIKFLRRLQQHTKLAKPDRWYDLLSKAELPNHIWAKGNVDYTLVLNEQDLDEALKAGLEHLVLIPAESSLGHDELYINDSTERVSDLTLMQLLERVLLDGNLTIDVQDLAADGVENLTCPKTCKQVKEHFAVPAEKRGIPWNCLEVADNLISSFPGPSLLKSLDFLERLQSDPNSKIEFGNQRRSQQLGMARKDHSASWIPGAKKLDRWLLLSEKGAISTDHVDVVVATWIRCIHGEKIFWFQNGLTGVDISVWQTSDDPRIYSHPWAVIKLRKGDSIIFPPGTIHAVWTSEDCMCVGGHFLYPPVMDRSIRMLKTLELKPYLTNDNFPVDIFKVVFGFTARLCHSHPYHLSPQQLARYLCALEDYANTSYESYQDQDHLDRGHMERKKIFLDLLKEEGMLERLSELVEDRMDPSIPGQTSSRKQRARLDRGIMDDSQEGRQLKRRKYETTFGSKKPKRPAASNPLSLLSSDMMSIPAGGTVYLQNGKRKAEIEPQDWKRLHDGELLNDNLINFYIQFLERRLECSNPEVAKKVYFFNSFFFTSLTRTNDVGNINYQAVMRWTRDVDIFSYPGLALAVL
ncbi:hypothetical protein ACJ73_03559 [Blastomyces percursus]|uniref:JmjC domain-containing protein n=1 Tax=Blastomyces percursus TaxID=1658174 RepID=A0A1J9QXX7_9EURO|nr:hypothetical protein ACJ73_03559 [Blastomyces percursus]